MEEENRRLSDNNDDDGDLIIDGVRKPVAITPENARFFRSKGNLISLDLKNENGEIEFFERIILLRAFPLTNPDEFLCVCEGGGSSGHGKELGMIRRINDFDEETVNLLEEELNRRYFVPQITYIRSIKDKLGYSYWDVSTTSGDVTFVLSNPFTAVRVLENGRMIINDVEGNSFEIPDPKKLDKSSYRKIEVYL